MVEPLETRTGRPPAGASATATTGRCFTLAENTPQPGHGASWRSNSMSTLTVPSWSSTANTRKPAMPKSASLP